MPMSNDIDKDLNEKIAYKQLLWKLGYYVQINIPVFNFRDNNDTGSLTRDDLTDIDVLGIIYDDTLNRKIAIGDCKSSKISHTRLLWVRGLQEYLSADTASFIAKEISPKFIEVARRLSIHLWNPVNINKMLEDYDFKKEEKLFNIETIEEEKKLWQYKSLNKDIKLYKNFIKYTYWELTPRRRLQSLIFNLEKITNKFEDKTIYYFLAYKTLILATLSILDIASFIIKNGRNEIHKHTESYIFGTPSEIDEKKKVLNSIKAAKNNDFYPKYYQQLLDLLNFLIRRADLSKNIPRYIETIWYNSEFCTKPITIKDISNEDHNSLITIKLTKDVANFICKNTNLDVKFYSLINNL